MIKYVLEELNRGMRKKGVTDYLFLADGPLAEDFLAIKRQERIRLDSQEAFLDYIEQEGLEEHLDDAFVAFNNTFLEGGR